MRKLTDHIVQGGAVAELSIEVTDAPDDRGACHRYVISGFDARSNPSAASLKDGLTIREAGSVPILFQNGPIPDVGLNGVTGEALLAIVIDRFRGFQKGPFACRENAVALTKLEESLMWLQKRTRDRIARGVEGTYQK